MTVNNTFPPQTNKKELRVIRKENLYPHLVHKNGIACTYETMLYLYNGYNHVIPIVHFNT